MNRRELITEVGKGVVAAGVVAAVSSVAPRAEAEPKKTSAQPPDDGGLYIRFVQSCQGEEAVWLISKTPFEDADPKRIGHI